MPTPNQTIETKDTSPTAKDIDPVENPVVEKKDVSTKDNTEKISQIEANITEIKSSVASLKTEIEDLDKSKSTLSKEVLTTKEKEIEDKKTAIEAKKTETQALIDAVRKDRIDLKLETLDADTKTVVEAQKVKEETLLSAYESDLKAIEVTKKTFWEKAKDKASKSRERVKENP
jgi:chromosome segregation ATPase